MELIIYEAKDWHEFSSKIKEAWKEFKGTIRTVAVKVLAKIIQIYIIVTSDDTPKKFKNLSKLLPLGAAIIVDLTNKSFPYGTFLACGTYYVYRKIKHTMNNENYQEALKRAEQILRGMKEE